MQRIETAMNERDLRRATSTLMLAAALFSMLALPARAGFPFAKCNDPCGQGCAEACNEPAAQTPGVPLVKPRARLFPVPVRPVFEPQMPPPGQGGFGPQGTGQQMPPLPIQPTEPENYEQGSFDPSPSPNQRRMERGPRSAARTSFNRNERMERQEQVSRRATRPHVAWFFTPVENEPERVPASEFEREQLAPVEPLQVQATPLETYPRATQQTVGQPRFRKPRMENRVAPPRELSRRSTATPPRKLAAVTNARLASSAKRSAPQVRSSKTTAIQPTSSPQPAPQRTTVAREGLEWLPPEAVSRRSASPVPTTRFAAQPAPAKLQPRGWSPERRSGNELIVD